MEADLRTARVSAGLSIRALAARAGVAASTVWRVEVGRLNPTVALMARLHQALRIHPARSIPTREEAVSLAFGRLAAAALLRDPTAILERARRRLGASLADEDLPRAVRRWATEWQVLIDGPLEAIVGALLDPSARGYELRQNSPFTGLVADDERVAAARQASEEIRAARSA